MWPNRQFPAESVTFTKNIFNSIHDGLLKDGGPKSFFLPKIIHTYPTMMKLGTIKSYLKKIQK